MGNDGNSRWGKTWSDWIFKILLVNEHKYNSPKVLIGEDGIMMDCFDKTEWWELLCGYSIQTLPPEGTLFFPYGTDNKRCSIVNGKSGIVAPTYMVSDERRKLYLQGMWKFEEKIDESP
jgi:hypothetical protein